MTPAHTAEELLGHGMAAAPTPHHPGIDANLPPEPLDNLQHDLPAMENMGYDQVMSFFILLYAGVVYIFFYFSNRWQTWVMTST